MREQLYKLAGISILLGSLVIGWLWLGYQQFLDTPIQPIDRGVILLIEPGDSLRSVAQSLARDELISDESYFRFLARLSGKSSSIQAGEYLLTGSFSPEELLNMLVEGRVRQHRLTLIEGWKFSEMLSYVESNHYLKHTLKGDSPEA
ncbi:MAG: endolytic transglycosylase MltG, partial [Chromatiales bacterium]|nr:endolytic transglycosylase MltG [Chromatiales bacterium]